MQKISVIGAGAWGTALATVARRAGRDVTLWAFEPEVAEAINTGHENTLYLPGVTLDAGIAATSDLAAALDAHAVLLVPPAQHVRRICQQAAPHWPAGVPAVICSKGIEQGSCALMTDVLADVLPGVPVMALSGPTFAIEVAKGLPTAVTLAGTDEALRAKVAAALATPGFRPYESDDLVGAEVGGAVKNVLAIACGIVEGLDLGENARAALITRGLEEIAVLAEALGGKRLTLMGLSGMGDLILTASSMKSRNFSLGAAIGQGKKAEDILAGRSAVTEGVHTAKALMELADKLGLEMPIARTVDAILNHGADLHAAIEKLLARPLGSEVG